MSDAAPVAISYSMGSSSEWLIQAVIEGVLPRPEHVAVFSVDTGDEHEWSYAARDEVMERCRRAGLAFIIVRHPSTAHAPEESDLDKTYEIDEAIRDLDQIGISEGETYLSDRLIPVRDLIRKGDPQPNIPALESYCDGGSCFL